MRKWLCITFLFLIGHLCRGGGFTGHIHPGISWGYSAKLLAFHHYNYLDNSIGFRIDDQQWTTSFTSNAFVQGSISFDLTRRLQSSVLCGYVGIAPGRTIVPVSIRFAFYPRYSFEDGMFYFVQSGVFFRKKASEIPSYGFLGGTGYRIMLASWLSLDLHGGISFTYDRPPVWDPLEETFIPKSNIRRNDAWYCSLNLGISLVF